MNFKRATRKLKRESENLKLFLVNRKLISSNVDHTNFIIVSRSRSGSNLLVSLLDSHPNVYARGEVFHNLKSRDPEKVLNHYFGNQPKNILANGFKVFYYHPLDGDPASLWNKILERKDLKFIHLKRKNLFKTIISREKALQTDQWSSVSYIKEKEGPPVVISPQEIEKQIKETKTHYQQFEILLKDKPVMELYYEDFVKNIKTNMYHICDFLGIPKVGDFNTNLKKQANKPLSERVGNYLELKEHFAGTEWENQLE